MTRRKLLQESALMGAAFAVYPRTLLASQAQAGKAADLKPLDPPTGRAIKVAFLISDPFELIDFAGPWEVFLQVVDKKREMPAFEMYTVSKEKEPIKASGGLQVIPDYTLKTAPLPDVVVVPAQGDDSEPVLAWLRNVSQHTEVTMSVCTGAFLLAKAGLLDGLEATTYHDAFRLMATDHPNVRLQKQVRFVDNGRIATSAGLSAGIDLALHVVARYFGEQVADDTAATLEYIGYGWKNPNDTGDLFQRLAAPKKGPFCPVCGMGPVGRDISTIYNGKTYYFCSEACKAKFVANPEKYLH